MLTHKVKYNIPQSPLPLPVYEEYVSVRQNVTYRYYGNHIQRVKTLHSLLKVFGGSRLPNIQ